MWRGIVFLLCVHSIIASAQNLEQNFETGNLTGLEQCPAERWCADSITPLSGNWSLHQNYDNLAAGTDIISLKHETLCLDSTLTTWQFCVFYNYNPSSANMWAVWLTGNSNACSMLPDGAASGYILGVNYQGSDDFLKLWRQDEEGISEIINTNFNWQNKVTSNNRAGIKVTRDMGGNWSIYYDSLGLGTFKLLITGNDKVLKESEYVGIYYKYTATQDRKLWIDDFILNGKFYIDTDPAKVDSFNVINRNTVEIRFNENIDTLNPPVFRLNNQFLPASVKWKSKYEAELVFDKIFSETSLIQIDNLVDVKGNIANAIKLEFFYHLPQPYEILITEILADPIPVAGLPECEYIEILNAGFNEIELSEWELRIGDKQVVMPAKKLLPENYYIVCDKSCYSKFATSVNVIGINSMPALLNTGDLIQLRDDFGKLIHAIQYSENWFNTEYKLEGGWSLEMIDIANPCLDKQNWKESIADFGGTPGHSNSVSGVVADYTVPEVIQLYVKDSITLIIELSEKMDSLRLSFPENYILEDEHIGFIPEPVSPFFNQVILHANKNLLKDKIYTINLGNGLTDCSGNHLYQTAIQFGMAELPDSSDILINEVLYESTVEKPEFIELYNKTGKVLELKNHSLAIVDDFTGEIKKEVLLSVDNLQVLPIRTLFLQKIRNYC